MAEQRSIKENMSLEDALDKYGRIVWSCRGRSMEPLIREGVDHVVIEKPDREIGQYDVVIYTRDKAEPEGTARDKVAPVKGEPKQEYVLHRVVDRKGDHFIILGDNCVKPELVPADRIIGVMTGLIRKGRIYDLDSARHRAYVGLWVRPRRIRVGITRARFKAKRVFAKATKRSRKD